MATRRNHIPANAIKLPEIPLWGTRIPAHAPPPSDDPRLLRRLPYPSVSAVLEDCVVAQHREIQSLLLDNQRLAATHVALKEDLSVAQQDLRHLLAAAADVKAEAGAQVRVVLERSLKLEAEVRSIDDMNAELAHVRADVQALTAIRQELTSNLEAVESDLAKARSEARQLPAIKAEIEGMHHEIQRGRAAIEYEKKTHASNLEQRQVMERNMVSVACEVEKLRAELANAEKRARAAAAAANPSPGYAASYSNPDIGYGGSSYPGHYSVHQVQGGVNASPLRAPGRTPHPYDMQQTHTHR